MKALAMIVIVALLALAILLPAPAAAVTITWTSTADFDGGTKSNPGDGNYGIETNTDNPGIAAGGLELASLKGDSFTLADADADTFKWHTLTTGTGCTFSIASGTLAIGDTNGGANTCSAVSDSTISGNFDVRAKVTLATLDYGQLQILNENVANWNSGTTVDGFLLETVPVGTPEDDINFIEWKITNGAATACVAGSRTVVDRDPTYIRIQYVGTTLTFYDSPDGSTWTTGDTCTFSATGPWYVNVARTAAEAGTCQWDNVHAASGTVDSGGYRTTGTWASASQAYNNERIDSITITYSGATATNYIDAISILSSADVVLWTDPTDVTSGTSSTTYPAFDPAGAWKIQITLAGGGAGTPTIEAISAETGPIPSGGDEPTRGAPGASIACSASGVELRCTISLPQPRTVGLRILESQWYVDGSFAAYGSAITDGDQEAALRIPPLLLIGRGAVNVTVLLSFSNGQDARSSALVPIDNSWAAFLIVFTASALTVVLVLHAFAKRESNRRRREARRTKKEEENWRWKLFERS